jgi:hypothetical protein
VGKFAPKPKEKPEASQEVQAKPEAEAEARTPAETKPTEPQAKGGPPKNAPLPPMLREKWDQVPDFAREHILKREGEISRKLSELDGARKTHAAFEQTLAPYRDMLSGEPMQVVGGLLQTAAVLKRGSSAEKAQLAAQMIQGHGIDIEALANALEGLPVQQEQQFRDPRVDVLEQRLAREEALRAQEHRQHAAKTYRAFAEEAEFLDSPGVRTAMEREMRSEWARGVELDYQTAYDRVIWALKDTRDVLLERERQKEPTGTATNQAAIARAKHAGSSVRTEPSMARVTSDNSIEANIRSLLG